MMKCILCNKRPAVKVDPYGFLPCLVCQKRQRKITKPKQAIEITTDAIKEDRKIFEKDITQPFRDGSLSKEYVKAYPDKVKKMVEEKHITEEEIKRAKSVWTENEYYKRQ